MGIPEKIARITAGSNSDFGARPSKLQRQRSDRLREPIEDAVSQKRKTIRQKKKEAQDKNQVFRHNPPPLAACIGTRGVSHGSAREEILGAMRGLDPARSAYVMFRYAQDRGSFTKALNEITLQVVDLHNERGWCRQASGKDRPADAGKDIIRSMVRLALFELNNPKCVDCKGAGRGPKGGFCRKCKGDGKMRIWAKDRAKALGINYHQYRNTYSKRYGAIVRMIKGMGKAAILEIQENLYGKEFVEEHKDELEALAGLEA